MNQLQQYVHLSRYARYLDDKKRRETWNETVTRFCNFYKDKYADLFPYTDIHTGILNMDIMPSMRGLMCAGPALERDNVAGYNCSYLPIDHPRSFDECMYILLCGTGVGFSVEREYISSLPEVSEKIFNSESTIIVADSKIGWASALRELISLLYAGNIPKWDLSRIRPAGARLKTFGGRASGPGPLDLLFKAVVQIFTNAAGRKLNSLEVHDIICRIADAVVVGGVRRSALISLSNLTDERLRTAKSGNWWEANSQRGLANNSVAYTEKPDVGIFMREWESLYAGKSGERGIFNRKGAKHTVASTGRRDVNHEFGTNPCGEIILRPHGFCNLSEVIVRNEDTIDTLRNKVRLAVIIGTFQSTLTNFRYLRSIWKKNAEEERLLGVSMTGIMDHPALAGRDRAELGPLLSSLKEYAIEVNKDYAERLGITVSAAITTVKPSGTVSQLVDSSSGIHPRYSKFYSRTVRNDKKDPLAVFMRAKRFPVEDDVTKPEHTDIFSFPVASPSGSVSRDELSAIEQLEHYLIFKQYWCEHNPSITVYIRENEWLDVQAWVYRNFDDIGGISFLPYDNGIYRQAPYTEITEEEYRELSAKMPTDVDWTELVEETDETIGSQELACTSGVCEIL